jgi:hypothetical protein
MRGIIIVFMLLASSAAARTLDSGKTSHRRCASGFKA